MNDLLNKLTELNKSDMYPLHMPGHKRKSAPGEEDIFVRLKELDITEITGFDDLHAPSGIISNIQEKAAKLYGAEESYLLINGSSAGILAALSAVLENSKEIIFARNSHKSAYNALLLNDAHPHYIWSEEFTNPTICGGINLDELEEALRDNKGTSAVYVTSPTYEGVLCDIESIADVSHKYGCPLIVDAAHGAHLGLDGNVFAEFGMKSPLLCGADAVIVSLHKTLNAPTQTGLLLTKGDRINKDKLRRYLSIYQTTSPSYVLMAMIENCIEQMSSCSDELFEAYKNILDDFYNSADELKYFKVLTPKQLVGKNSVFGFDVGKIVIALPFDKIIVGCETGKELFDILRDRYHLELEYASDKFVLAMTSIMDSSDGLHRLIKALLEIENDAKIIIKHDKIEKLEAYPKSVSHFSIKVAISSDSKRIALTMANGCVAADFLYAYPPGVPIIVPGEIIDEDIIRSVRALISSNIEIRGMTSEGEIQVVDESKRC